MRDDRCPGRAAPRRARGGRRAAPRPGQRRRSPIAPADGGTRPSPASRHEPAGLGDRQRGQIDREPVRRPLEHRQVACCRWSPPAPAPGERPGRARRRAAGTRARSARTRAPGPPRGRARDRARRWRARSAQAGCRRWLHADRSAAAAVSPRRSAAASPLERPASRIVGRSAPSSSEGSPSRTAIRTAIGSATSRRKANSNACALEPSSQWASSTRTATGPSSAYAASRLSVAAPTANRSWAGPGRSASAPSSAAAWGSGIRSTIPSAGRNSSSREANGIWASDSIPRARRTRIPAAQSAAWSSSAVLPIPASPTSASVALVPARALSSARSMAPRSLSRPTSTPGVKPPDAMPNATPED